MKYNAVTGCLIYGMSLVACVVVSMVASADDAVPKPDEKPPASSTAESDPKKPAEPKEKSLLEKLGDELMKEVDDTPGVDPDHPQGDVDKMDRAVKGMRSGGGGGGGGSSSGGGGGGSSGRNGRGGGGSSLRRMRPQGSGGKGKPSGQAQPKQVDAEEQSGGTSSENGVDSSKMSQADRKASEEAARKQKLEMDVWGHLPQHVREELLNTYGERMLPKYEHLVKQFYEALSTQGTTKKK